MRELPGRMVTATYRVPVERQPEFFQLMIRCEAALRKQELVTGRGFTRMRSIEDPEILVEIFEWVDSEAFGRAQVNPAVLEWWGQFELIWKEGGFGLNQAPESAKLWAQYVSIG